MNPALIKILSALDEPAQFGAAGWTVDYESLGISAADIPGLTTIALQDTGLGDYEPGALVPLHAWRALIQFGDPNVVGLLLQLSEREIDDDDDGWLFSDLLEAAMRIGPSTFPEITAYLNNRAKPPEIRKWLPEALERMSKRYPELREDCIRVLMLALSRYREQDDLFNASIAEVLAELHAIEAAPLIEEVYRNERAELAHAGDWEDIQVQLGMIPQRLTERVLHPFGIDMLHGQSSIYLPPLDQLLELGEPPPRYNFEEPIYATLGIGDEQIPDLIRMVCDDAMHKTSNNGLAWAPIHAWRALAELRAEEAIDPLISQWYRFDKEENYWISEEFPDVFAAIGPAAIPALSQYATDQQTETYCRTGALESLVYIANGHPDHRANIVAFLAGRLENAANDDATFNAHVINALLDFRAVEYAPLMKLAYDADLVDIIDAGDWEDAQIELGLLEKRITPPLQFEWGKAPNAFAPQSGDRSEAPSRKPDRKTKKAKRKQQKASRKRNRR